MRFLEKKLSKQNVDGKMTITAINWSTLKSPSTSDDDDINTGVSKIKYLEPTIKHLIKETRLTHRAAHNLVMRGHNIIVKNIPDGKIYTRSNDYFSRYNTITVIWRERLTSLFMTNYSCLVIHITYIIYIQIDLTYSYSLRKSMGT